MSKNPNIRWRKSDTEKLTQQIEKFNAKIYRTRSKHPELADILPDTIKKTDKIKMIEDLKQQPRSEFNKTMNSLNRFNKRGAEQEIKSKTGNRVTKWEKNEVGLKVAEINRQRTIERKLYNVDTPGQFTRKMGEMRQNELKEKKYDFNKIKGGTEWKKFKETVNKQSKANYVDNKLKNYKKNYINAVEKFLGEDGVSLNKIIDKIPPEVLYEHFWGDDPVLNIQFTSDPLPSKVISDEAISHWKTALGEDYIWDVLNSFEFPPDEKTSKAIEEWKNVLGDKYISDKINSLNADIS